jgi:hypothetical protein
LRAAAERVIVGRTGFGVVTSTPTAGAFRLATPVGVVAIAFAQATAGCLGEGAAHFHGSVLEDAVAGHAFHENPNPDGLAPVSGVKVFVRIHDQFPSCDVPLDVEPHTITDNAGTFDTDNIGFGADVETITFQLCFLHSDFMAHEVRVVHGATAHETNGTRYLDVTLRRVGDP